MGRPWGLLWKAELEDSWGPSRASFCIASTRKANTVEFSAWNVLSAAKNVCSFDTRNGIRL